MTTIITTPDNITWRALEGTCCASDVGLGLWEPRLLVQSHRTQEIREFYLAGIARDQDNDVTHATYRSMTDPRISLTVFND